MKTTKLGPTISSNELPEYKKQIENLNKVKSEVIGNVKARQNLKNVSMSMLEQMPLLTAKMEKQAELISSKMPKPPALPTPEQSTPALPSTQEEFIDANLINPSTRDQFLTLRFSIKHNQPRYYLAELSGKYYGNYFRISKDGRMQLYVKNILKNEFKISESLLEHIFTDTHGTPSQQDRLLFSDIIKTLASPLLKRLDEIISQGGEQVNELIENIKTSPKFLDVLPLLELRQFNRIMPYLYPSTELHRTSSLGKRQGKGLKQKLSNKDELMTRVKSILGENTVGNFSQLAFDDLNACLDELLKRKHITKSYYKTLLKSFQFK